MRYEWARCWNKQRRKKKIGLNSRLESIFFFFIFYFSFCDPRVCMSVLLQPVHVCYFPALYDRLQFREKINGPKGEKNMWWKQTIKMYVRFITFGLRFVFSLLFLFFFLFYFLRFVIPYYISLWCFDVIHWMRGNESRNVKTDKMKIWWQWKLSIRVLLNEKWLHYFLWHFFFSSFDFFSHCCRCSSASSGSGQYSFLFLHLLMLLPIFIRKVIKRKGRNR